MFGEIDGYPVGSWFSSREELHRAGLHRRTQHGISGRASDGADAIALSGGYRPDRDFGDVIVYTGEGAQDGFNSRQIEDQTFTAGNAALVTSGELGLPVRLIRGFRGDAPWRPEPFRQPCED